MREIPKIELKKKLEFTTGLRLELFYALEILVSPAARIHKHWRERSLANMPDAFSGELRKIGNSPALWPILADTLNKEPMDLDFESILSKLQKQKNDEFQREVLYGAIHYDDIVEDLLEKKCTLAEALGKVPKPKQEWLAFIGLYPYQKDHELIIAMELLLKEPKGFKNSMVKILELFWKHSFKNTWRTLLPQFQKSMEEKERLFQSCTFDEFAKHALLRIEVNDEKQLIKAVRGGALLSFADITHGYLMPSAFNDKRYWTTSETAGKSTVFFPYFDPSLSIGPAAISLKSANVEPELDVCLIFKALGDPTRIAIASIISKSPTSSVELAKSLSITKPAISHHVHLLREAGLISEVHVAGSIHLSLKREVIESLSHLALDRFFSHENKLKKKSRSNL